MSESQSHTYIYIYIYYIILCMYTFKIGSENLIMSNAKVVFILNRRLHKIQSYHIKVLYSSMSQNGREMVSN